MTSSIPGATTTVHTSSCPTLPSDSASESSPSVPLLSAAGAMAAFTQSPFSKKVSSRVQSLAKNRTGLSVEEWARAVNQALGQLDPREGAKGDGSGKGTESRRTTPEANKRHMFPGSVKFSEFLDNTRKREERPPYHVEHAELLLRLERTQQQLLTMQQLLLDNQIQLTETVQKIGLDVTTIYRSLPLIISGDNRSTIDS